MPFRANKFYILQGVNMTINKTTAVSLAASTLLSGALFAGTLTTSGTGLVAEEIFQGATDLNVSIGAVSYAPTIGGSTSVNGATFKYSITGGTFAGTANTLRVVDASDNNTVVSGLGQVVNGNLVFSSIATGNTVYSDRKYEIRTVGDENNTANIPVTVQKGTVNGMTVCAELYSTSGTEVKVDEACNQPYSLAPQYNVYCETKLNNLINVENAATAFVATKHGALLTTDGTGGDVMNVLSDVLRFTVEKTAVDYGLDGNGSILSISADNNTSAFDVMITDTHNFASGTGNNDGFTILANGTSELNVTDAETTLTDAFYGLGASKTTYTVQLDVNGTGTIPETVFKGNFYIQNNSVDTNTTYTPAATSYEADSVIGEWTNFAYIAQIPAVSYAPGVTKVNMYITNRSCSPVTPTVKLIRGGEISTVTLDAINPDTQAKTTIDALVGKAMLAAANAGNDLTGNQLPFAVEITIPGNAEDFYVGAQMINISNGANKDLPVYNTSERSN